MHSHAPSRPLLSVRRLRVYFQRRRWLRHNLTIKAVDDIHFDLRAGDTLSVVGETGSGKSALVAALLGQLHVTAGSIVFDGVERVGLSPKKRSTTTKSIHATVQSPVASFGKRIRVDRLLGRALDAQQAKLSATARQARIAEMLDGVGLVAGVSEQRLGSLEPAARARVALAIALLANPALLIADGPADGLDADERFALSQLILQLQHERGFALILTAREFGDVAPFARRSLVMTLGHVVEQGPSEVVVRTPAHPYSRRLLQLAADASAYEGDGSINGTLPNDAADDIPTELPDDLPERMPSAENPPMGCVFHTRCGLAERICVQSIPTLKRTVGIDHYAACHFAPVAD